MADSDNLIGGAAAAEAVAPAPAPPMVGVGVIEAALKTLPLGPGVYRMIDAKGKPLYVGKARSLKKRVAAYTKLDRLESRLRHMVQATAALEIVTTHTEVEALLLESNLIKQLKPHYNVLLRDDKSFPYILLTSDTEWPQLLKHRGARDTKGEYFGPFASAGAVNRTLNAMQRAFPLRSCSDAVFATRTRPCLQFQIKRCTGPCVARVDHETYDAIVEEARGFLTGRTAEVQEHFAAEMQAAAEALDFEAAAQYRDRIRALTQVQAHQDINVEEIGDADVIAAYEDAGTTCVQVFFFRNGQNFGNRTYFPAHTKDQSADEVLAAFIGQFYASVRPPKLILVSHMPAEQELVEAALAVRADRKVTLHKPERGARRKVVDHALSNAREALARRLAESASQRRLLEGVAEVFGLEAAPERIEVYDNSHVSGTHPVGAMIVAGPEGLVKKAYRKFNIRGELAPGDDYGMIREVMTRRFARALKEDPDREQGGWPDLVLIDGGAGQLASAREALAELGIDDVPLAAISKGPDRNAGREHFHVAGRDSFMLGPRDPVLYFLQRLRDEAHRFAIGGHRTRRSNEIGRSLLDEIQGIGRARKKALLHHFGSAGAVARAGLVDLEAVAGISKTVAKKIYDHFHAPR
jgi:excinuclease ABC subunit C